MPVEPITLPISRTAFATALRTGHGRAQQHIQQYGADGLEDLLIEACLTCRTFDPQCEAQRAPWLFSMIDAAQMHAAVFEAIKTEGLLPTHDTWDLRQRSALLKALATGGLVTAKTLLYESLAYRSDTVDVIAAEDIVALDGVDGLIHVARHLGQWLRDDPDFWVDDALYMQCFESDAAKQGLARFEHAAASDTDISRYLAAVHHKPVSVTGRKTIPSLNIASDILAHLDEKPKDPCHWFSRWGAQTSSVQREIIFAALISTAEPEHATKLFKCFTKTGLPRFERRLLRWITHTPKRRRWAAVTAFASLNHPEVRTMGMQLMAEGDVANGLALLVKNFAEEDFSTCAEYFTSFENDDELHDVVWQILRLCESNPRDESIDCLLYVYERSPCSACRSRAVNMLIDAKLAPDWLLGEAALDADPDTRKLIASAH